ncbi:asparagine synthetase [glutamine-hydrolyzing] [Nematostella vectensis]|uniref:asparagine synthetase [glutamine-hydrolyzing] n=1 Tax=Nematostella vectensis TaxID=45351 RepID=UPI0020779592|nr:asparagine synthetase [glutamine-hydrolyzing] [Nematostella vectensis]
MCGIWAVFGYHDYHQFMPSIMAIRGRGPDAFRTEPIPGFHNSRLAFHRLAIVGDVTGMQPMRIKQLPHLVLIYNGEIYNHKQLVTTFGFDMATTCDAEVILHLYNKFGDVRRVAKLLDGVFAFSIVDSDSKQVHLGRDTFGVRPMFTLKEMFTERTTLALSSEAKSLVLLEETFTGTGNGHKLALDPFPPGHYATFALSTEGKLSLQEEGAYTYVGKIPTFDINFTPADDQMENIRRYLSEAVKKRLMADRRIGCFLSGGLDSSLVAAILTKHAKEAGIDYPIQTFSIGLEGSTDLVAARKVAKHIGSEHHEVIFTPEEGIQALRDVIYTLEIYDFDQICPSVALYLLSKYVHENTETVVLYCGEGADELCQGYVYFHKAPSAEMADQESRRLLKDLYLFDLVRVDRATAAFGLEARVPFLDVPFTSFFLSLPAVERQPRGGVEKWLLRAAYDGTGILPDEILWRTKTPFSTGVSGSQPGKSWLEYIEVYAEHRVSDGEFARASEFYEYNTPTSKVAFFCRKVFEEFFPGHQTLTPFMWLTQIRSLLQLATK